MKQMENKNAVDGECPIILVRFSFSTASHILKSLTQLDYILLFYKNIHNISDNLHCLSMFKSF